MLCVGFLAVLLLVSCHCQAENFRQGIWKQMFTLDVVAPGASLSTAARSELDCARQCLRLEDCKTSAFHQHSATCWLYRHLVVYGTTGMASPGTRYFWRLSPSCPGELGYQLDAGICLKVYTTEVNRMTAEKTCRNDGGHLLIADTSEKRNAVSRNIYGHVWLGASDQDKEGEWRWLDGTLVQSDNWSPNSPDNYGGIEHFLLTFSTGLFYDIDAQRTFKPACQIPLQ